MHWIQTGYNAKIDFDDDVLTELQIEDIANALSNICRFGGHCNKFYSVAEHCVSVSYAVPTELALSGLLHDASEAYIGDVAAPLKYKLGKSIKELEDKAHNAVAKKYNLTYDSLHHPLVKQADLSMLKTEAAQLMPQNSFWNSGYLQDIPMLDIVCIGFNPEQAYIRFLDRFKQIIAA